jgi:hypothetical protein
MLKPDLEVESARGALATFGGIDEKEMEKKARLTFCFEIRIGCW